MIIHLLQKQAVLRGDNFGRTRFEWVDGRPPRRSLQTFIRLRRGWLYTGRVGRGLRCPEAQIACSFIRTTPLSNMGPIHPRVPQHIGFPGSE
jgi:hypothetical protein